MTNIDYWLGVAENLKDLTKAVEFAERRADILQEKLTYAEQKLARAEEIWPQQMYRSGLELVERDRTPCDECSGQRWIWGTCGEGTCDNNDPCHACNADQKLPMNWEGATR